MRAAIYARTSTTSQILENQILALEKIANDFGWNVEHIITDHGISGAKGRDERPGFDKIFMLAEQKDIDVLMVWSVDRVGRSLQDLVALMNTIQKNSVDLYCHQQAINTSTPAGRMTLSIFAAVGEYEREIIKERINAGIERAKSQGIVCGRKRTYDKNDHINVINLYEKGIVMRDIATQTGIGYGSVYRIIKHFKNQNN